jgi:hypothetical protein
MVNVFLVIEIHDLLSTTTDIAPTRALRKKEQDDSQKARPKHF